MSPGTVLPSCCGFESLLSGLDVSLFNLFCLELSYMNCQNVSNMLMHFLFSVITFCISSETWHENCCDLWMHHCLPDWKLYCNYGNFLIPCAFVVCLIVAIATKRENEQEEGLFTSAWQSKILSHKYRTDYPNPQTCVKIYSSSNSGTANRPSPRRKQVIYKREGKYRLQTSFCSSERKVNDLIMITVWLSRK